MKSIRFLGNSLKTLRGFPPNARQNAGHQLDRLQRGLQPADFKPMPRIGKGVEELRIWDATGTFRIVYTSRSVKAVTVLHAFEKKSQATLKKDIDIAKTRYQELARNKP